MAAALYTEIYLLCIIIVGLCQYWSARRSSHSASERWLHAALVGFLVCFTSNLLFTLVNRLLPPLPLTRPASWLFMTLFHMALCFGVFAWCGYADTECRGALFATRRQLTLTAAPLLGMEVMVLVNLHGRRLFDIGEGGYARGPLFHLEMGLLTAFTLFFGVRLLIRAYSETDPVKKGHLHLLAAFPACLLVAWALSTLNEGYPVICAAITVELLCLFMSTSTQQISLDKLTQVNNRQNLLGFLEYRVANHSDNLFLFMMDLDYFKTINDTYGHLEGDDALVIAARALKLACGSYKKRPYIARYGGDEFIVVIESSRAEAEALLERIRDTLNELSAQADKPYTLAFSIGVAEYQPGMGVNDLIETADRALYEIKRARPDERRR